jgi:hypothetical protein
MRKKVYGSDVSREQFDLVRPLLEGVRRRTKPRTVDLYEVFCGVLYLLKSGCQWRMLPGEFPKWRTVHSYFQKWSEPGPDGAFARMAHLNDDETVAMMSHPRPGPPAGVAAGFSRGKGLQRRGFRPGVGRYLQQRGIRASLSWAGCRLWHWHFHQRDVNVCLVGIGDND